VRIMAIIGESKMSEHKLSIDWNDEREKFRREAALKIFTKAMHRISGDEVWAASPKESVEQADALIEALEKRHERS
jgi:hypothetical protein